MLAMDISRSLTPELLSAANALSRRSTVGLSTRTHTESLQAPYKQESKEDINITLFVCHMLKYRVHAPDEHVGTNLARVHQHLRPLLLHQGQAP